MNYLDKSHALLKSFDDVISDSSQGGVMKKSIKAMRTKVKEVRCLYFWTIQAMYTPEQEFLKIYSLEFDEICQNYYSRRISDNGNITMEV